MSHATTSAIHPADALMHLIVTFLAPMFLGVSGGDIHFARAAAMETVRAYQARNQADLIAIAQIVAYGLAALGSLSLSMADDISISMTLRLRGNANALNRSAEQNRRALRESQPSPIPVQADIPEDTDPPIDHQSEAEALASLAETQRLVAERQSQPRSVQVQPRSVQVQPRSAQDKPGSAPAPHPPTPTPAPTTERDMQAMWANAMTDVAAEFTADLKNLPPQERRQATMRIQALSTTAHTLLSSATPSRLQPGDLATIMQPRQPNRNPNPPARPKA